jgi:hypothetical protein
MSYQREGWGHGDSSKIVVFKTRSSPRNERLVSTAFADPDTPLSRLNSAAVDGVADVHVSDARILIIGFGHPDASAITRMLRDAGTKSCATCTNVKQLSDVSAMRGAFTHVIVNLDAFEDIDDAVTALMIFRLRQKNIVVILISDAVAQDDLLPDRKRLCDATLRAPVSFNRLCDGLLAAWINNKALSS